MAAPKITRKPKKVISKGNSGGSGLATAGAILGAGLGAAATGGAGAATGAGLGSSIGGAIGGLTPATQGSVEETLPPEVPGARSSFEISNESQQLLAGIKSLSDFPRLAEKYTGPLTSAYLQTQIQLKQKG